MVSKTEIINHVRELAQDLGSLCAEHDLVRLETLLWATEQQAVLEALIEAADLPGAEESSEPQTPERAA